MGHTQHFGARSGPSCQHHLSHACGSFQVLDRLQWCGGCAVSHAPLSVLADSIVACCLIAVLVSGHAHSPGITTSSPQNPNRFIRLTRCLFIIESLGYTAAGQDEHQGSKP